MGEKNAEATLEGLERNVSRRTVIIGVASAAALLGMGALRYLGHTPLVHPPGGQSEAHLVNACIRCERCYEACPRGVIKPAHIEDGLLGMRAPQMSYDRGYCDYCADEFDGKPRCVAVCPTGALNLSLEDLVARTMLTFDAGGNEAKRTQIEAPNLGLATIDKSSCLAFRDTGCRFCFDACPLDPKAIELYGATGENSNPRVRVIEANCNGCGACESVCVSLTAGSIAATGATERAAIVRPLEVIEQMREAGEL